MFLIKMLKVFLDYKNGTYYKINKNICIFTPHFGQNLNYLTNLFLFQKGLDMMFDYADLAKRDVFLDYKNVTIR